MKFSSSVSAVQNRTFRPLLERLEDRLVPGETFGAALPLSSFVCPYLALLGADATPGDGATATAAVSETSSDSYVHSPAPSRYDVPAPESTPATVYVSEETATPTPAAAGSTQSDTVETTAPAGVVGSDSAYVTPVATDPAEQASIFAAPEAQQALLPANEHTVSFSREAGASGGSAAFTPAPSSFTIQSAPVGGLDSGLSNNGAVNAVAASEGSAEPMMVGARQAPEPGSHPSPLDWNGTPNPPYTPQQMQHAYGFDLVSNKGAGQTIYIVDAFNNPTVTSDLTTFDSKFGLPAPPSFTVYMMSNRVRNDAGWGLEEDLDVQWAHAIAPQANIVLVEATTNSNSNLYAAVDWATNQGAKVVSMSWGANDFSGETAYDSHFNHSGVAYVVSSGDTGGVVQYPSASPYTLSVGGTSLTLDANGNYASESAWVSGGGGASLYEAEPAYQTNYGITGGKRVTPDVSYNADPNTGVYVYDASYNPPGWYSVGGTSAAAPQWAALIALADQSRGTPLGTSDLTSRFSYNAATGSAYATNYHDIATGSNGYSATAGYDKATGVGSPQANNLVGWLASH